MTALSLSLRDDSGGQDLELPHPADGSPAAQSQLPAPGILPADPEGVRGPLLARALPDICFARRHDERHRLAIDGRVWVVSRSTHHEHVLAQLADLLLMPDVWTGMAKPDERYAALGQMLLCPEVWIGVSEPAPASPGCTYATFLRQQGGAFVLHQELRFDLKSKGS